MARPVVFAWLFLASCTRAPSAGPPASDASATPAPAPPPELSEPTLADVDLPALQKRMRCAPGASAGACMVLAKMVGCRPWNPVSPSGEGRYIGHGWVVVGDIVTEQITLLRTRSVPMSDVASWQLPVKIAFGLIPTDAGPAYAHAERAINAFERHDVPRARNAAIDFLKQKSDWVSEAAAARTRGSMVMTFSGAPAAICQGADQQVLVAAQSPGATGRSADGLYAELWAATW
jgi:hypothetical protein